MSRLCSASGSNVIMFKKFIKARKKLSGMSFTHTSISGPRGSYYIDYTNEREKEEFFELYHHFVFVAKRECFMTEAMKHDVEYTPIRIDLDFRRYSAQEEPERLYALSDIIKICQLYFTNMRKFFIFDEEDGVEYGGRCFILEKECGSFATTKNNTFRFHEDGRKLVKDGVHIMFPNISTSVAIQLHLRDLVYKNVGDILDHCQYDNSYADIFDKAIINRNNWLMYGSKKKPGDKTYTVSNIFDLYEDGRCVPIDIDLYTSMQLVKQLSIRNKDFASPILATAIEFVDNLEDKYIEMENRRKKYAGNHSPGHEQKQKNRAEDRIFTLIEGGSIHDQVVPGFLNCLSDARKTDYTSWIEVGFALHNIDNVTKSDSGEIRLLEAWHKWSTSKGAGPYEGDTIETCRREWYGFRNDGLKLGSLKMWARKDAQEQHEKDVEAGLKRHNDPTAYDETVKLDVYHIVEGILKGMIKRPSEFELAKLAHSLYHHMHRLVSITSNTWFYFNQKDHRWKTDENGNRLRHKLCIDVHNLFLHKLNTLIQLCSDRRKVVNAAFSSDRLPNSTPTDIHNDEVVKKYQSSIDKCITITSLLRNDRFLKVVMNHCALDVGFYDQQQTFNEQLDSNMYLLGFTNGVYDLKCNKFRPGNPDDMISMTTNIEYIPYDEHAKEIREIKKFLSEILPNKAVRDYVVHFLSTVLEGTTKYEKFVVWSGSGGNGKSKLVELVNSIMGDYKCIMNVGVLTQKRGAANGPSPEIHKTKGKRFVTLHEPDSNSTLNVGLMKGMTGGDEITARGLNKDPICFKPQFKMVICCNDKPKLPPNDGGVWRRITLVEFVSRFVDNPKGHYEYPDGTVWLDPSKKPPEVKYNSIKSVYEYPDGTIWHEMPKKSPPKTVKWIPDSKIRPQYPRDINMDEKFETWKEHFMAYLLHIHETKQGTRLKEPPEVLKWTNAYRKENEHFTEFMESRICVEQNMQLELLSMTEIYSHYTQWYTDTHPDRNKKTMKELKEFLIKEIPENHVKNTQHGKHVDYFRIKIITFEDWVNEAEAGTPITANVDSSDEED